VKFLILFVAWCILLVLAWPVALLVLVLARLVWLLSLPFRVVGPVHPCGIRAGEELAVLPARLFGYRG